MPEAPDAEDLGRALTSALDIARQANVAQADWNAALLRIDRILEIECELHRPLQDLAGDRMNRANVLRRLHRYGEAQAELEACLEISAGNPARSQRVLSSLASLFDDQDDVAQAVELQRRALAMCELLPDPRDRAISHNNLAIYLARTGTPSALAEAGYHRLADLVYVLVAELTESMRTSLRNYAIGFRRAKEAGTAFTAPRLTDLLAQPAFRPLAQWLDQRGVDREALQAELDQHLETARQTVES